MNNKQNEELLPELFLPINTRNVINSKKRHSEIDNFALASIN